MKQQFFALPDNASPRTLNAIRYATFVAVAAFLTLLLDIYLCFRIAAWQIWVVTGLMFAMVLIALHSRQLILHGKKRGGARALVAGILIIIGVTPYLIAGLGVVFAITGIMLIVLIASQIVENPERFIFASFITGFIAVLSDLFLPPYRLVVPEVALFAPFIATILVVILGFMTVRRFQDFSLRTKMIIVIVTITMVAVATIAFLANRSFTAGLIGGIGTRLTGTSNSIALSITEGIDREVNLLKTLSLNRSIRIPVLRANQQEQLSQAEIEQLDKQWQAATDNTDPLIESVMNNYTAADMQRFAEKFPQHVEIILTGQQGVNLAASSRTSDYYQADEEWWQIASEEGLYLGQPEYDESTKTMAMVIAIPVRAEESGETLGVLRTTITLHPIMQSLVSGLSSETDQAVIYLPDGQELALERGTHGAFSYTKGKSGFDANALNESKDAHFEIDYRQTPMLASQSQLAKLPEHAGEQVITDNTRAISKLDWRVIVFQDQAEALQPIQAQTRGLVLTAFVIFIAAIFAALAVAQVVSGPLIRLNAVAERVAAGDLSAKATVETGDETGALAQTFNSMTTQLRDLIGTLEHRVAERTKALATSAEISRYLSTILNERQLVVEVVEQLKAAFDYYHVQIYLLDETSEDLIMAGGTGDVGASLLGSGHRIPKGKGLVGRAARNNVPVLASDTSNEPDWLPNLLLPETRSEAALPIATGDKVLGVLDVQHSEIGGLKREDVDLLQSLASQVAIALQNARSYTAVQQRAEREARIATVGQKIQATTTVEAALQVAARELGHTLNLNEIRVILELPNWAEAKQKSNQVNS